MVVPPQTSAGRRSAAMTRCLWGLALSVWLVATAAGTAAALSVDTVPLAGLESLANQQRIVLTECGRHCLGEPAEVDPNRHATRQPLQPDDIILSSDVYVVWDGEDGVITLVWDGGSGPERVIWDRSMEFQEEALFDVAGLDLRPTTSRQGPTGETGKLVRRGVSAEAPSNALQLLVAGAGALLETATAVAPGETTKMSEMPAQMVWEPEATGLLAIFTRITRSNRTVALLTVMMVGVMYRMTR